MLFSANDRELMKEGSTMFFKVDQQSDWFHVPPNYPRTGTRNFPQINISKV